MPHLTKIATCCYCGTRAALVLKGRERHELACSSCGAPLHEMKAMPVGAKHRSDPRAATPVPSGRRKPAQQQRIKNDRKPKKSKRKSRLRYFAKEAFDLIEDIFD